MNILYTTDCPKCTLLKKLLNKNNIEFIEVHDVEIMIKKGIDSVPVLEIDGVLLSYNTATEWVKNQGGII